ncbi:response regulator [Desulfolucanica intricata]|uniref:response regulator n=1 Tax=Desulfolucanica intricata TaxID=1285191 RepID=UPI000B263A70|nr:response regulator [Desulfolucanica intricata]
MTPESISVLIVDDQSGVRYLLDIIVREEGHKVYTAENGMEAVEMVRSVHPDLVFMDVRMPVMSGLEALVKIKKMAPATQVVIMTAYGAEETVEAAMRGGALTCIAKPFDVEEIKDFLQEFCWKRASLPSCTDGACCG